jgi:acetyltransferase-like isoleucine patch superfamily enzyme/putative methionine-R-sulfoxide reductase with GAF domain
MYRTIFAEMGTSVRIYPGVEFSNANRIEIGNRARIRPGVHLKNLGQNSKILIGDGADIDCGVYIKAHRSGKIEIGENSFIGPYACLSGEFINVGKDCLIAAHAGIYAINHNFADSTRKIKAQGVSYKKIVIEDDCWLGSGVRVVDGVTIGQGSVIGAGAVVTKDIPPYSVAVGVPAHVIASRKSSEETNSARNQEYTCKEVEEVEEVEVEEVKVDSLPVSLSTVLTKVEETAKLIHREVEEAELSDQPFQSTDTALTHSVLQNLLYQLLHCIRQVMAVDTVTVLLQAQNEQQLAVRATLGLEEEITQGIRIPVGRGFAGRIAARRKPLLVEDLSTVEVVSPILRNKGIQSMLGVPLSTKDGIGVFHIGTLRPRQFTKDEAQLLQLVAKRIGLTINCLQISNLPTTKDSTKGSELVREKFALTCSDRKVSQAIRNLSHLHLIGFLRLAPSLISATC